MNYVLTFCLAFVTFSTKVKQLDIEHKRTKGVTIGIIITLFFAIIRGLIKLLINCIF